MAASLNRAQVIGNLGKDPESKTLGDKVVTTFSVATSFVWKDKNGEKQEKAEWHNIVTWGKLAEICAKYLTKGSKVMIEGRMQTRSWDDEGSGKKMYRTEIVADNMMMLGEKRAEGTAATSAAPAAKAAAASPDIAQPDIFDLPF